MNKKTFDKLYVKDDTYVCCPTFKSAERFLNIAHKFGYKWRTETDYILPNGKLYSGGFWSSYEEGTCYRLSDGCYGSTKNVLRTDPCCNIVHFKERRLWDEED